MTDGPPAPEHQLGVASGAASRAIVALADGPDRPSIPYPGSVVNRSLDLVADKLAESPIELARAVSGMKASFDRFERLPRPLAFAAGVVVVLPRLPRALRAITKASQRQEIVAAYRSAVGVDRDRAHADIAAVEARLGLFLFPPDDLVRRAARWLVQWVAEGRPSHGVEHAALERKADQLLDHRDRIADRSHGGGESAQILDELSKEYEKAWIRLLASEGTPGVGGPS